VRLLLLLGLAWTCAACPQDIVTELDASVGSTDGSAGDSSAPGDRSLPPGGDGGSDADAGATADVGPQNDAGPAAECFVSPFDVCSDPAEEMETNNSWPDAFRFNDNMSVGCVVDLDEIRPLDRTASGILCHTEPADYYSLTVVTCDSRTMLAEIRLHLRTDCPESRYDLIFLRGGRVIDCGSDPNVECSTEGGDRIIRIRVPPDRVVASWQFAVQSESPDVVFQYDLSVTLQ